MSLLGPSLIFAALFAIGFFPMQRLKSKRAAVISALLGIALVPIGLVLLRAFRRASTTCPTWSSFSG